ncbi:MULTISPECIES: cell wall-binding repeat-containing protein [unclassified Streptomyces]|uniref:cell wall-binding repeat-containing protein n=1 Tax=unclassified Streptomyces TaxID=2593676 RepID=UPI002367020F|nr:MULTISPECIES: cell wall-binding repeat-containing protein [unclassified Streptomyces]MDF3144016.1 cell wall-binding repeat-containing protein [Streptomyces sp. T21Q-yed]WDF39795.1 cell wall-binding repeat-containing protein [Streptomyces sp. T12]
MRTRRTLAALTGVAALAAGLVAAVPGPAVAASGGWPATDGKLLYTDGGGWMNMINTDGSSSDSFGSSGNQGAWSADGSQIAFVNGDQIRTAWADSETTGNDIGMPSGSGWHPADPTFWYGGGDIVFTAAGRLRLTAADGTRTPKSLFGTDVDGCDSQPSGAVDGTLAFVRTGADCAGAGTPAVWAYNGRTKAFTKLADNAREPSVSPDGLSVAFTRSVDGHKQLFSVRTDGTGLTQLTTDAIDHNRPAWSPLGDRIAYDINVPGSPDVVGGPQVWLHTIGSGEQTQVPMAGGTDVAWQPLRDNAISRVWGSDTYDTNIAASKWTWNKVGTTTPGLSNANAAVLISKSDAAYATTATSLAGKKRGPVLMTSGTAVDSPVQTELKRMLPKGKTVYLIGGTKILSSAVASKVTSLGYVAKRLSDVSRYSTSVAVAKAVTGTPKYVFLATGTDYHNALAASSAAGSLGSSGTAVVLLTEGSTMTASVYGYLNRYSPSTTKIITVGTDAESALSKAYNAGKMPNWPSKYTYYRVAGGTPQSNAIQLARLWWSLPSDAAVASVSSWRGGVSAASAMTTYGPLLWTDVTSLPYDTKRYLMGMSSSLHHVAVFGGNGSVDASVLPKIGAAIGVGTHYVYTPYYKGVAPQTPTTTTAQPQSAGTGSAPSPDLDSLRVTATK